MENAENEDNDKPSKQPSVLYSKVVYIVYTIFIFYV